MKSNEKDVVKSFQENEEIKKCKQDDSNLDGISGGKEEVRRAPELKVFKKTTTNKMNF